MSRRAAIALLGSVFFACRDGPSPEACVEVSRLVANPTRGTVSGIRIGPVFVATGRWAEERIARLGYLGPSDAVKFLIQPLARFESALLVTGKRCGSSQALRFSFALFPPFSVEPGVPVPDDVLDRTGTVTLSIPPPGAGTSLDQPPFLTHHGYFIFRSTGRWMLELDDQRGSVGYATLEVYAVGS